MLGVGVAIPGHVQLPGTPGKGHQAPEHISSGLLVRQSASSLAWLCVGEKMWFDCLSSVVLITVFQYLGDLRYHPRMGVTCCE